MAPVWRRGAGHASISGSARRAPESDGSVLGRALLWASESRRLQRFVSKSKLSRPVVRRFVAGDRLDDAVAAIRELNARGIGGILDLLGEGVADPAGAEQATQEYARSIEAIVESGIDTTVSIKLTQLGMAFDEDQCLSHVKALAQATADAGTLLEIDMEQVEYVDATLRVFRALREEHEGVRLAIQSYLRRTQADLEAMADLKPRIRLVKGAYSEDPAVAFQSKAEIDAEYRRLAEWLFGKGQDPGIASHDGALIDHAQQTAERTGAGKQGFEYQFLYGVRRDLQDQLVREGYRVRVYVPFGAAWYHYLMRRMAEHPANLKFFLRAVVGR
jgi:proline dehydrogenase